MLHRHRICQLFFLITHFSVLALYGCVCLGLLGRGNMTPVLLPQMRVLSYLIQGSLFSHTLAVCEPCLVIVARLHLCLFATVIIEFELL